jgi:hypothetical protein
MYCPRGKNAPQDCPRCEHVVAKSNRYDFFNINVHWKCNYPYIGDTNVSILELRDKKDKQP